MEWAELDFGKHKGRTLPQIIFNDPDYFFGAWKEGVFEDKSPELHEQAKYIYKQCQRIKIPDNNSKRFVIEYSFYKFGDFCSLKNVPRTQKVSSDSFRKKVIDFSVPYKVPTYCKTGYKMFLHNIKTILFGSGYNLTKKRCEEFFDEKANFL